MGNLVMKRLASFLILTAFFLGISGARIGRPDVKLEICASHQGYPQFCIYLPCDDSSGKSDGVEQPLTPPGNFVFLLEPSGNSFLPLNCPSPASPSYYGWLGLGCGGLPS
jgi:hypothetical protein